MKRIRLVYNIRKPKKNGSHYVGYMVIGVRFYFDFHLVKLQPPEAARSISTTKVDTTKSQLVILRGARRIKLHYAERLFFMGLVVHFVEQLCNAPLCSGVGLEMLEITGAGVFDFLHQDLRKVLHTEKFDYCV